MEQRNRIELEAYATTSAGNVLEMNTKTLQVVIYDEGKFTTQHKRVKVQEWLAKHPVFDPKKLAILPLPKDATRGEYVAIYNTGLETRKEKWPRGKEGKCAACNYAKPAYVCRKNLLHKLCGSCANLGQHETCPLCSIVVGAIPLNEE